MSVRIGDWFAAAEVHSLYVYTDRKRIPHNEMKRKKKKRKRKRKKEKKERKEIRNRIVIKGPLCFYIRPFLTTLEFISEVNNHQGIRIYPLFNTIT